MDSVGRKPGPAARAAPEQHADRAGLGKRLRRVVVANDVAIGQDGDRHGFFDVADPRPIGFAFVELLARAAMDRQRFDAAFLRDLGKLGRILGIRVPAQAHLQRDRHFHRLDGCFQNARGGDLVAHQGRARMAVDHFFHRAAKIDVDDRCPAIFVELGSLGHHTGLTARQLHGHRKFFRRGARHKQRLAVLADHRLAGDHLRNHQSCAMALDQSAKRQIRNAAQRRQNYWGLKGDRTDFYAH